MSFWQSEDDFRNWVNSDAFKQGHARSGTLSKETFSKPSHLETYEAFLDTKASVEQ
jgi:heme-degrading monooxygenase HmoA